ncbi:SIS domain-containing protein [candidate division KSB1 bacterium]|nr:SIS domain-containing protein [candidate division KSB1 bacterium]
MPEKNENPARTTLALTILEDIKRGHPDLENLLTDSLAQNPQLGLILSSILEVFHVLNTGFASGKKLFLCGNGGSYADAMHITAELMKSFHRKRPVPETIRARFNTVFMGAELFHSLEVGFPAICLGLNQALNSALENDISQRYLMFAQELYNLGRPGDMLLGISTSGNALNVALAFSVARVKEITTIALTGQNGGRLVEIADWSIQAPATVTPRVQEFHIVIYHLLTAMIEAYWYKNYK